MFIKRYFLLLAVALPLFAGVKHLSLDHAIKMLKKDNLELKISRFNEQMKQYEAKAAEGFHYGKLDLTVGKRLLVILDLLSLTLQIQIYYLCSLKH